MNLNLALIPNKLARVIALNSVRLASFTKYSPEDLFSRMER